MFESRVRAADGRPERASDSEGARQVERRRLVLADDDEDFARPLCALLRRCGYEVITARDARQAREVIARGGVDLLLTDIYMPGNSSVLELLAYVRREWPSLPCIVMTGRPGAASAIAALRLGAGDYLSKPFDFDELHARIQQLLDRGEQTRRAMRALETLNALFPALELPQRLPSAPAPAPPGEESASERPAPRARHERWDSLSEREREVVETFARTPTVAEVARALEISVHTVRNHFRAVYRKLEVHSQIELISLVRERDGGAAK